MNKLDKTNVNVETGNITLESYKLNWYGELGYGNETAYVKLERRRNLLN